MAKIIHSKNRSRKKNGGKDVKVFYKLINNAMCGKTLENLRKCWYKNGKQQKNIWNWHKNQAS